MSYQGFPSVKLKTLPLRELFPNDDCILIHGAMTTPGRFEDFVLSQCHLGDDGKIRRYRVVIGTIDDIEIEDLERGLGT